MVPITDFFGSVRKVNNKTHWHANQTNMPLFQIDVSDSAVNVSAMLRDGALVEEGVKEEENEEGEQKTPKLKPLFTYADQMPIDTLLSTA